MDKISKALNKLSEVDKKAVKKLLVVILRNKWQSLDVKKLKGFDGIIRIRKGKLRIIINKEKNKIKVVKIEKRNDKTYNLNS